MNNTDITDRLVLASRARAALLAITPISRPEQSGQNHYFGSRVVQPLLPYNLICPVSQYSLDVLEPMMNPDTLSNRWIIGALTFEKFCEAIVDYGRRAALRPSSGYRILKTWLIKAGDTEWLLPLSRHDANYQRIMIAATLYELFGRRPALSRTVQKRVETCFVTNFGGLAKDEIGPEWVSTSTIRFLEAVNATLENGYGAKPMDWKVFVDPRPGSVSLHYFANWYTAYFIPDKERPNQILFHKETRQFIVNRFTAAAILSKT